MPVLVAIVGSAAIASSAAAVVVPPTTIDQAPADITELGGVAMAPDGTGGLVYTKAVNGVPHLFASRYDGERWGPPIRVDSDQRFEATSPQIAAGAGGRLLVVWATPDATVAERPRYGLFSASLGPGANGFAPSLLVDPDVGSAAGVTPSLAGVVSGKAIVAYRVVTNAFPFGSPDPQTGEVQLRPGDVMADVRVARLSGDRWSRLGAINRNPGVSMRAPSEANGPKVGIAADGNAVVAWQEPDRTGVARIWAERVFGTTQGSPLEVSPTSWEGRPVDGDASAFGLAVTEFGGARVAMRIDGSSVSSLGGPRILLNTLPPSFSDSGTKFEGAEAADGGGAPPPPGAIGVPSVAATQEENGQGSVRVAFTAAGGVRESSGRSGGHVAPVAIPAAPPLQPGAEAVTAVDPAGGGIVAWPSLEDDGAPALAVRQDFSSGAAQTGLVSGALGGPISTLVIGRSGGGDALIAFLQGEPGRFAVLAERVSAPPARFTVKTPKRWVRPPRAKVSWGVSPGAGGNLSYSVLLDGRAVREGLPRRLFKPAPGLLGTGVHRVQVLATDRFGQQLLSATAKLRVDAQGPVVRVRSRPARRRVTIRLGDKGSGLRAGATRCRFGDGSSQRGGKSCKHVYGRPGRYEVFVRARDRAGNRTSRHLEVRVG